MKIEPQYTYAFTNLIPLNVVTVTQLRQLDGPSRDNE